MQYDQLSDDEVLSTVTSLSGNERGTVVAVISLIREVEDRRLERRDAYASIHDFCFRALKLSECEARRRIHVARMSKRCPQVLAALASGAVNLTNLDLLRDVMTEANADALLADATGRTKAEVEMLVATHDPKPDVPSKISRLPDPEPGDKDAHQPPPKPLSPGRHKIQMTGDDELCALIKRAQQLTRHTNPLGDMAVIFKAALAQLVPILEKEKRGIGVTARASAGPADPCDVSAATRREVIARDGEQCAYVSPSGERCPARDWLEIDHRDARALGGEGTAENLRVLCRAHNQYEAEQQFGRAHVEKKIAERRAAAELVRDPGVARLFDASVDLFGSTDPGVARALASEAPTTADPEVARALEAEQAVKIADPGVARALATEPSTTADPGVARATTSSTESTARDVHATLKSALVGLGFRNKEVTRAMNELPAASWTRPIEDLVREALAKLTS